MKMTPLVHRVALLSIAFSIALAVFLASLTGCGTTSSEHYAADPMALPAQNTNDVVLKEGDVVRVIFPNGGDKSESVQTIRPDGKITLQIIGDVTASGKTPKEFRKDLVEKYSKEIVSSQDISVVVVSSSFQVYVTGAVMRSGKVTADHPLTALEAIMEAGGYDQEKAQLKSVKVVRTENGRTQNFVINLKGVRTPGATVEIFFLHPGDIVIVPQKIVLF